MPDELVDLTLPEDHYCQCDEDAHAHGEETHYHSLFDFHTRDMRVVPKVKACEPSICIPDAARP